VYSAIIYTVFLFVLFVRFHIKYIDRYGSPIVRCIIKCNPENEGWQKK